MNHYRSRLQIIEAKRIQRVRELRTKWEQADA